MRKLTAFTFISLNGYYKDAQGGMGWHVHGREEGKYSEAMLAEGNVLLFGRLTYEMMAYFWPSPMALETAPVVAAGMNSAEKIVFSNTLNKADWNNTSIMGGDIIEEMKKMKASAGKNMALLGSGSILSQFAEHGLIDEYQVMIDPIALSGGTAIFQGISKNINLTLTEHRIFESGVVLLTYRPT